MRDGATVAVQRERREKARLRRLIIDPGSLEQPQKWGPSPSVKKIESHERG